MGEIQTFLVLNKAVYHCILQALKTRPKVWEVQVSESEIVHHPPPY